MIVGFLRLFRRFTCQDFSFLLGVIGACVGVYGSTEISSKIVVLLFLDWILN
jgi:hypothetical protein